MFSYFLLFISGTEFTHIDSIAVFRESVIGDKLTVFLILYPKMKPIQNSLFNATDEATIKSANFEQALDLSYHTNAFPSVSDDC